MECEKLAKYMQSQGISTEWWERVLDGTQDPWEKLKLFDTNHQMVQFNMKVDPTSGQINYTPEK